MNEGGVLAGGERQMTVWVSTGEAKSLHEGSVKKAGGHMSTSHNTKRAEQVGMPGRAEDEMGRWRKTLSPSHRAKLEGQASQWGRNGGSIVAPKRRRTRTARRNEKLRREREPRFQAERADYEARLAAPWKIEKSRAA
jgi:hypothetical protein